MFWRVSCKIVAESQNHQIIGGSNPKRKFPSTGTRLPCSMLLVQLEYAVVAPCKGYHIYQVLWEPQVWEGFFCSP